MSDLLNVLLGLRAMAGEEAFAEACRSILDGSAAVEGGGKGKRGRPSKKEKKEKKTRERTPWNIFVGEVWAEMKKTSEKVKYSEAMSEAKRRKDAGAEMPVVAAAAEAVAAAVLSSDADKGADEAKRKLVFSYLFELQESGKTNMMGAGPYLQDQFGMDKYEAEDYLTEYISNYSELKAKYGEPAPAPVSPPAAATKGRPKKNAAAGAAAAGK